MKNVLKRTILTVLIAIMGFNLYAQNSENTKAEPYSDEEFPQWAHDLRRGEIITLGSLPFVTIGVTLIYGATLYFTGQTSSFPNPLNKNGNSFTSEQTMQIFGISFGVSTVLGITDWVIQYKRRRNYDRMQELIQNEREKPSVQQVTPEEAHEILRQQAEREKEEAEAAKKRETSEEENDSLEESNASGVDK